MWVGMSLICVRSELGRSGGGNEVLVRKDNGSGQ